MTSMSAFSAPVPRQIGLGVEELISQAKRLGLLQTYRPATITDVPTEFSSFANFLAILDGDDAPIPVQSLVGGLVVGTRVMVMTVPPQGVYVIGFFGLDGMAAVRPLVTHYTVGSGTIEPTPGAVWYDIEMVGGGGAGGGAQAAAAGQNSKGAGGGGGAYARETFSAAELGLPISYTVGAGGIGVSAAGGGAGGLTSIGGGLMLANGGGGGNTNASSAAAGFSATAGLGGIPGTGQFTAAGGAGGIATGSANLCGSGSGGDSMLGGGAAGRASGAGGASANGFTGGNYGGGGSGAFSNSTGAAATGGNGAPGIIIVRSHFH